MVSKADSADSFTCCGHTSSGVVFGTVESAPTSLPASKSVAFAASEGTDLAPGMATWL